MSEAEIKVGSRVLVRPLDVFGRVAAIAGTRYTVACESPLRGYVFNGEVNQLRLWHEP